MQQLNEQQLQSICSILADTNRGLTKTEIKNTLRLCHISEVDDGNRTIGNGMYYQIGSNKRDWLYNCFATDINQHHTFERVFKFIESALSPINYTTDEKRSKYKWLFEEVNKVLLLIGLQIDSSGKNQTSSKSYYP